MPTLIILSFIIALYFILRGIWYFIKAICRFLYPMFIMVIFGTDKALQSEVERTSEYEDFENELNKLTK